MKTRRFQTRSVGGLCFPLLFTVLMCLVSTVEADEVLISDGSRLYGDVMRHDTKTLRLKTSFAGTLEIDWAEVREVIFSEPGTVLLTDDRVLEIMSLSRDGDQYALYTVTSKKPVHVQVSDVKAFELEL